MAAFDVSSWLTSLNLPNLIPIFIDNGLTEIDILKSLTEEDLKSSGVTLLGQRKKLLIAISAFGEAGVPPPAPAAPTMPVAAGGSRPPAPPPLKGGLPKAAPKAPAPIPEIRRAKWWPGAQSGALGKCGDFGAGLTGEFESNPFIFVGDELVVLGYGGISFWRPGVTSGAHKVLQNPKKNDWTYRGFDILGKLMVVAGGYTSIRGDIQIWSLATSKIVHEHHRANDHVMWDACFLDQGRVFVVDNNHTAQIVDVEEGFTTRKYPLGTYCNRAVRDPFNESLIYVGANDAIRVYDVRVAGENYSMGLCHGFGRLPGCGFVKKASIKENELFVGSPSGVKQFDCRTGLPIAESKQEAAAIAAHCNILAVGWGCGLRFFDTNQGLATPVHEISETNSHHKWMEMNENTLCVSYWGDHMFAVTWAPPAGKK